jgi:hypothetical protein
LRRKRAIEYSQQQVSTLLIYRDIHDDDEGCVEVGENVPVDVEDGRVILEKNDGKAVTKEQGDKSEEGG